MFLLNDSFRTPEQHLAHDEGLLDAVENFCLAELPHEPSEPFPALDPTEVLRFWQFDRPVVVMGRSSRISEEVDSDACQTDEIPVLRRSSGGASIVAGPGCLMYTVLIDYRVRPAWRMLDVAHQSVMEKLASATQRTLNEFGLNQHVEWLGTCDLTIQGKKFSGNALRCRRHYMIYHGTILIQMPLDQIAKYLKQPPRQPDYRENRDHLSFVCNLLPNDFSQTSAFQQRLVESLASEWQANKPWNEFPHRELWLQHSEDLLHRKYLSPNWHRERL
ncbi:MAG: lipoate--protein ligase family protein [Pirellula sp.]|jgi:lipoate-protein ligase A|nr:lipoate--protein ligase family protein [Pirellula sp.]